MVSILRLFGFGDRRTFVNERGNLIDLRVTKIGKDLIRIRIIGPESEHDSTVTRLEARNMRDLITEVLML